MTKQHRRTWQRHEQRIARALGTERNGPTGTATNDVCTSWLSIECKSWGALPKKVVAALEQAEAAATPDQLALAVIHQVGQRSERDLVILRWGDFLAWHGDGTQPQESAE